MDLVVYADFASPLCWLANCRADALRAAGIGVDWRAVERAPRPEVTGERPDAAFEAEYAEAVELRQPGEPPAPTMPAFVPNTSAAIAGYAEAYGAGVADDVRRLLFRDYWYEGVDIGNPEALRTRLAGPMLRGHSGSDPIRLSGYAVSLGRGPVTTGAWRRMRAWQEEWAGFGAGALPVLVENGLPVFGAEAVQQLGKAISRAGAEPSPNFAEPERYPAPPVRAPAWWARDSGGRWLYAGWQYR
ncbi:hypothetical protein [Amycolatopsis benzoatilytica]|uniref:hypothetical protein n=1 Tax=Amycolatopsis benzoatilytica TaxID=346045 RepID=UPI00036237D4|nr:hypothetical protein [Amycolatopsis benzoatilytica]